MIRQKPYYLLYSDTANVRRSDGWYKCDDNSVPCKIGDASVISNESSLLFFVLSGSKMSFTEKRISLPACDPSIITDLPKKVC